MKIYKKIGVWMDHAIAHLIALEDETATMSDITSSFTHEERMAILAKSEFMLNNKERQLLHQYYTEIGDVLKKYDKVILFGPTDAKLELYNFLKTDHHFDKINIAIEDADKMTSKQREVYVKFFFKEPKI